MLSKSKIKLIRSLEFKKYRDKHRLFIVEGDKTVREMLNSSLVVESVLAKKEWLEQIPENLSTKAKELIEINDKELSLISFLKTPNQVVALVQTPQYQLNIADITSELSLYLDGVQDPGNLGAIIRLADWFGISHVLCGEGTADPFNPKTVQATMGSIIRVKTYQTDETFFQELKIFDPDFPVYGTFLDGENIYEVPLPILSHMRESSAGAIIVMGNESKGIRDTVAQYVSRRLFIPSYPPGNPTSESLNVASAAAIVCAEFRRRS